MTTANTIISYPGFLTVTVKEQPGYVYFDWENFEISLDDCMDAFKQAEQTIAKKGVFYIVSNTTKVTQSLKQEVATWWGTVCMPSLATCGVRLIVSVVPASVTTKSGNSDIVNNIVLQSAHTVREAESLVQAFQSGKAIEKEQFIKATPQRVFQALTVKTELEKWFVQKAELQLAQEGDIRIEWAPGIAEHGKVKQVKPSELFSFTWEEFSPTPTSVRFELQADRQGTLLRLTHSRIGDGENWGDYYANLSKGWAAHLKDLTSWVETGTCPPPGPRG